MRFGLRAGSPAPYVPMLQSPPRNARGPRPRCRVSFLRTGPMAITLPIFMDYHSTTPVDPRVLEEMLPYFTSKFGNAASRSHQFGWQAEEAVDYARERIGTLIGAQSEKEIVF